MLICLLGFILVWVGFPPPQICEYIAVPLNSTQSTELLFLNKFLLCFLKCLGWFFLNFAIFVHGIYFFLWYFLQFTCILFVVLENNILKLLLLLIKPFMFNDSFRLKKVCPNCFSSCP